MTIPKKSSGRKAPEFGKTDGSTFRRIYKVIFNEIVNIPMNLAAIAKPRSSLIRCGQLLKLQYGMQVTGTSESMLVVYNPAGFKLKKTPG